MSEERKRTASNCLARWAFGTLCATSRTRKMSATLRIPSQLDAGMGESSVDTVASDK